MKKKNDYFGLTYIVSLILAIFPLTSWIIGAVVRLKEEAKIAFVVRLFFGYLIYFIDLLWMILHKAIFRFLSVV